MAMHTSIYTQGICHCLISFENNHLNKRITNMLIIFFRRNYQAEMLTVPENGTAIDSQYFNSSNDVKIVTHGWLSGESTEWLQKIKNSFLKKDYNVILVDWSELADNPIYPWSALSTRYVGKRLSKLISAIKSTFHVGGESFHLIGHSLGAQVMGYAGMFSEHQIRRITGEKSFETSYL